MTSEEQIRTIWNRLTAAVEESILRTGGFTPVGGAVNREGNVEAVIPAGSDDPVDLLDRQLRLGAQRGDFVATVRATNATVQLSGLPDPSTGILLRFDNADGVSMTNFLAYQLRAGEIVYGELHRQEGEHDIYPRSR